ncbi:MAG: hypothetical protein IPN99_13975 [Bacteroidetes bacterium]|nr:hypothetical protein [Bacteroidota bacterium]
MSVEATFVDMGGVGDMVDGKYVPVENPYEMIIGTDKPAIMGEDGVLKKGAVVRVGKFKDKAAADEWLKNEKEKRIESQPKRESKINAKYDAELKAVEQSLKETPKAQAKVVATKEEAGGVGVGGDVVKPTFENVPILTRTAEEIETAKNEVFNNLNRLEVGSVIENSDGEIKVVTEKSTDKKGNQLIGIVTYERQSDGSLRQMTNIVWASKSADGKIKLDYNPHSTGTNLKGERVTVTDQITDKKIDLSKENIFTEDENGNLIQINKVEPSLKESPESGSVGVGGDVESRKRDEVRK